MNTLLVLIDVIIENTKKPDRKILFLQKQYYEYKDLKIFYAQLQEDYNKIYKNVTNLQEEVKKKQSLILEYEDRFETLEEQVQNITMEKSKLKYKLESQVLETQRNAAKISKKNEEQLLLKEKEILKINQKRDEWRKGSEIMRRSISCLNKEKHELIKKLDNWEFKVELKQYSHKESQTETNNIELEAKTNETLRLELANQAEKNHILKKYSISIENELCRVTNKLSLEVKKIIELNQIILTKETENKILRNELLELESNNKELKRRKEISLKEINKLLLQLNGRRKLKGNNIKEEHNLLLSAKSELEAIYKGFLICVFQDGSKDKIEIQSLIENIDMKIHKLIEKIIDYCDDKLEPALFAKLTRRSKITAEVNTPKKRLDESTAIKVHDKYAEEAVLYNSCEVAKNYLINESIIKNFGSASVNQSNDEGSIISEFN